MTTTVLVVKPGDTVLMRGGSTATVTRVDLATNFLYVIDGENRERGRTYSWTRDGFYYTKDNPSGRDIVEVLSA